MNDWSSAKEVLNGNLLSVILPVHNLGNEIVANLKFVADFMDASGLNYELVPVDDGSSDNSAEEIRKVSERYPSRINPVLIEQNQGKGNALKSGFCASKGEFILLLDGDLDIAPKKLPRFFDSMRRHSSDIVVGSKRHPESNVQYPFHRRIPSIIYFGLVHMFIGLPVTDTQTGMKLFRRKVLGDALDRMLVKTYAFDLELLSIAYGRGATITEAPVDIRFGQKFGALKPRTVKDMVMDTLAVFYRLRLLNYYAKVEVPPPLERNPLVSIVIACPNWSWMLKECLDAIAVQTYRNFEVIVLPDGEVTETTQCPNVRFIPTGKVRPAEKRNTGINEAKGEVVAFIDDDAYPDLHWIESAVKYFSEPSVGGVGGPGVTPPGDSFMAKAGGRVYENIFVSGNYRYRYLGGRVRLDVDDYPSCNLFVRTDILKKIGGYRTDFWPGEDTLLCEAIVIGEHKRIVYDPWSLVYHHRRPLFGAHLRQLGRYGYHRGYFVKRFPATSCKLSYFIPSLFLLYMTSVAALTLAHYLPGWSCTYYSHLLFWIYSTPLLFYLVATFLSAFSLNVLMWLLTWLGIITSHLWYGVRFIAGLMAKRMPCEYIGKDHPSDKK